MQPINVQLNVSILLLLPFVIISRCCFDYIKQRDLICRRTFHHHHHHLISYHIIIIHQQHDDDDDDYDDDDDVRIVNQKVFLSQRYNLTN